VRKTNLVWPTICQTKGLSTKSDRPEDRSLDPEGGYAKQHGQPTRLSQVDLGTQMLIYNLRLPIFFFSKSDLIFFFVTTRFLEVWSQKDPIEGIMAKLREGDEGRHLDVLKLFVWTDNACFPKKRFRAFFFLKFHGLS